jgi:hypothetical protein
MRNFGPTLTPYKHVAPVMCFEDQIVVESSNVLPCPCRIMGRVVDISGRVTATVDAEALKLLSARAKPNNMFPMFLILPKPLPRPQVPAATLLYILSCIVAIIFFHRYR